MGSDRVVILTWGTDPRVVGGCEEHSLYATVKHRQKCSSLPVRRSFSIDFVKTVLLPLSKSSS